MSGRQWTVIANPENRRVGFLQEALAEFGLPPARVVSYVDVLRGRGYVNAVVADVAREDGILRIESPGENAEVERLLVGAEAQGWEEDPGRIRSPRRWFQGFSLLMLHVEAALESHPAVRVQNHPRTIVDLFDKQRTHEMLAAAGLSVPRALPVVYSYDELRAAMKSAGMSRVFVKLSASSSAAGVVAFSVIGGQARAVTSLELVRDGHEVRFYNNLRLSVYDGEADLRTLFDFLSREDVHVEEWLPKASQGDRTVDLRIVTIARRTVSCRRAREPFADHELALGESSRRCRSAA